MERFSDAGVREGGYVEYRLEFRPPHPPLAEDCPDVRIAVPDEPEEEILVEFCDEEEGTATRIELRSIVEWVKRNRPEMLA